MNKYIITFSKKGQIKFTSHLDINRMFRRIFRKCRIKLEYSKGFNPHPKMNFAQPLSLGYEADNEMLEITTAENYDSDFIKKQIEGEMPEGIVIKKCEKLERDIKSIAALADEATYEMTFDCEGEWDWNNIIDGYLKQKEIVISKLNKKKKKVTVDIRGKIRALTLLDNEGGKVTIEMRLDCGSASNLSPEHVIPTLFEYGKVKVKREDVKLVRKGIILGGELI